MQVEFYDAGSVAVQMSLQIHDGTIAVMPNRYVVARRARHAFAVENLRMDARDEHLLVVGPIKDTDPPAFGQITSRAPQKIVLQFDGARPFEAEHLTALRIDPRHHMLDGAIFSSRIHCLKDEQRRIAVGRV